MALEFSKSCLYVAMKREVYIELPDEDTRKAECGIVLACFSGVCMSCEMPLRFGSG